MSRGRDICKNKKNKKTAMFKLIPSKSYIDSWGIQMPLCQVSLKKVRSTKHKTRKKEKRETKTKTDNYFCRVA